MIKTASLIVVALIGVSIAPLISLSQQPIKSDFPEEEVKEANKKLDWFLEYGSRPPFKITNAHRRIIVNRYLGDADKSPHFWEHLSRLFHESREAEFPCKNCASSGFGFLNESERKEYVMSIIRTESWGALTLKSDPTGATVFLRFYETKNYLKGVNWTQEGQTILKRKYPEGEYIFVVKMTGHKDKEVKVIIDKDNPIEEKVILEKQ